MKRVFVKRILRPSSVSRLMQPGDESLLVRFTDGSGQVLHASQFNTLSESHFSVQTTRATSEYGHKKPNKLQGLSTFREAGHVNQLDIGSFFRLAAEVGFRV